MDRIREGSIVKIRDDFDEIFIPTHEDPDICNRMFDFKGMVFEVKRRSSYYINCFHLIGDGDYTWHKKWLSLVYNPTLF